MEESYFLTRIFIREDTCADGSIKTYYYPQYKRNTKIGRFFGWSDMSGLALGNYKNSKILIDNEWVSRKYNKRKKEDVKAFIDWWVEYQQDIRNNEVLSRKYSHEPYPD